MKKILILTAFALALASCDKAGIPSADAAEKYIDASSKTVWHYYSLACGEVVGSADESAENNAAWGARTDWDIALQQYKIRTNSGKFTSVGARGGVFTFDLDNKDKFGNIEAKTSFASVQQVPATAEFAGDRAVTTTGMGGVVTTIVHSDAVVIQMKKNADGFIMPPVYVAAPVYIFRSADGLSHYKVQFTQYHSEEKVSGHVRFNVAKISK